MGSCQRLDPRRVSERFRPQPHPRRARLRRSDRRGGGLHAGRGQSRRVRHRGRAPRQRLRRDVRPAGPPRRDARHRERRAVGHARVAPRGRVRLGQRRHPGGHRGSAVRRLPNARSSSASNWRRPCPATPPPSTSAPPPGPTTRAPTPSSCGRTCSTRSPTSTTAATASTRRTCGRSPQLNFANARNNPNAQTRDWTVPDPLHRRRRRPTRSSRAGCAASTAAR